MGRYRLLEHTADMGIEAEGKDLPDLFLQAALGLREMIFGASTFEGARQEMIEIEGADLEELLVNWLNEILFLFETRGLAPARFVLQNLSAASLKALVVGEDFLPDRHVVEREVKMATYHQLQLEQTASGWRVRIYVDL